MQSHKLILAPLFLLTLFFVGCRKGADTIDELQKGAVNEIISNGDVHQAPEPSYEETSNGYTEETASNNRDFLCNGKRIKETVVLDKLTLNAFDDRSATNTASLYPGSIIKIKDYSEQRDLNGIGNYQRRPLEVSSDLGDIREVMNPAQRGNVDKALKEMEEANPNFAAKVISESTEAYSLDQAMLHVGVDAKYLGQSVKGRFDFSQTIETHSFVIKFYQIYHTASVSNPTSPSELFDPSVDINEIQDLVQNVGPLGYITEVAYGRMMIGVFTYRGAEFKSSTEIQGKFRKGLAKVNTDLDLDTKKFFRNSTFKVAILGGDAQEAAAVSGSGVGMESVQAAYRWMEQGGKDASLGVPIQYKIRQLADPSYPLLAIGGVVEYEVPDCDALPNYVTISSIDVTAIPSVDKDNDNKPWDAFALPAHQDPDVFLDIQKLVNGKFEIGPGYDELICKDCGSDEVPFNVATNYPVLEKDLRGSFLVQFVDEDFGPSYHTMGEVRFNFRSFLRSISNPEPSNPYPTNASFNSGSFTVALNLTWETR